MTELIDPSRYISYDSKQIQLLFSPQAKYMAASFLIGTQKQLFYGQPIVMSKTSELIATIPDWSKQPIELASGFTLTETNIKGFLMVWLLMNDLIDTIYRTYNEYTLKDLLIILEWMNYFNYTGSTFDLFLALENRLKNKDIKLDDETRILLEKFSGAQLKICLATPSTLEGKNSCKMAYLSTVKLGHTIDDEMKLISMYSDPDNFVKYLSDHPLSDLEKKWANILFDFLVYAERTGRGYDRATAYNLLEKLKPIVGRGVNRFGGLSCSFYTQD